MVSATECVYVDAVTTAVDDNVVESVVRIDYLTISAIIHIQHHSPAYLIFALRRCKALGAKQAFVISDQEFYKKLGFARHSKYIFFKKS